MVLLGARHCAGCTGDTNESCLPESPLLGSFQEYGFSQSKINPKLWGTIQIWQKVYFESSKGGFSLLF